MNGSGVVAAFHYLPALTLLHKEREIDFVFVACDRPHDHEVVVDLTRSIEGLRPIHVGSLMMAKVVEEITLLLLNAAKLHGCKRHSVRLAS